MAKTAAERAAEYRARQRAELNGRKPIISDMNDWARPVELRSEIAEGAKVLLEALAKTTGTARGIIIERALYEYCSKYKQFFDGTEGGIIAARPLQGEQKRHFSFITSGTELPPKINEK